MTPLLVLGSSVSQELPRKEAFGQVVNTPVALAPADTEDAGLGECLEDRADLVRWSPVPVDGRPGLDIRRRKRTILPNPRQQLCDERVVLVERGLAVACEAAVPGDAVPRHLGRRQDRQALVVGLVQPPLPVQPVLSPVAPVAGDPA